MKSYSKEKTKGSMVNYQVLEELGSGSYGRVYRIKSLLDQKEYALKRIDESNIPSNYDVPCLSCRLSFRRSFSTRSPRSTYSGSTTTSSTNNTTASSSNSVKEEI